MSILVPNAFKLAQRICLCMIVRDESDVIARCLKSVQQWVSDFCIVDTGSTDNTKAIIKGWSQTTGITGEIIDSPWKDDFAFHRNEAIKLAQKSGAEYLLFIDADEELVVETKLPFLVLPAYSYDIILGAARYPRVALVKASLPWYYKGKRHEYLTNTLKTPTPVKRMQGVTCIARPEGARSKNPNKYLDDAAVLEVEMAHTPDPRTCFYLAQSYKDANLFGKALEWYIKRVEMSDKGSEEHFWAAYNVGLMLEKVGATHTEIAAAYMTAHREKPSRVEPFGRLAAYFMNSGLYEQALALASAALDMSEEPAQVIYSETFWKEWALLDIVVCAASFLGHMELAYESSCILLSRSFPEEEKERFLTNHQAIEKMVAKGETLV